MMIQQATHWRLARYRLLRRVNGVKALRHSAQTDQERINWAESLLGIPDVWVQTMGSGIKVAVLDTGIDPDHPDLKTAIVASKDFTGDGIEDANGHGTHCAGIIGARMNDVGFVGVAPKCDLMVGKVLNNAGQGDYGWISAGIQWAVDAGADIISMSLGGPMSTHALYRTLQLALAEGITIVCAAGNEGSLALNNIGFPGRYGGVITVASHDMNGNRSGFSSRGGEIDVMAPGTKIWSTYKDGGYAELSGTSMATPFVAGLAALILAKHRQDPTSRTPVENCEDMRDHLLRMAAHPGYHDNNTGYGPLQPFRYFGQRTHD